MLKVNVDPPLVVLKADDAKVDVMAKSEARAVVAPVAPDALIVHAINNPARDGLVLLHASRDADVGLP